MPKELTHWMLAEEASAFLPDGSRIKELIARHQKAYLGGAVLPDTLAHIFRGPFHPRARTLGHRFHDPAESCYRPVIRAEKRLGNDLSEGILSCLLGVISHMEADIALHPYVYALGGSDDIGEHYRVETGIDVHFLQAGGAPAPRTLEKLLCPATREVMVTAAGHLFDPEEQLPRQAIEHALELHCRFQAMYDRTLWKLAVRLLGRVCGSPFREQKELFYPLGAKGAGFAAGAGNEWRHPESGELKNSTVADLAQEAVERTVEVFRRIEEAGTLAAALEDRQGANLLTGLYGVRKKA